MLELRKVTKIFNQGTINERVALDQLDFEIKQGDFITVIGSNGSGKSTLLNIISGTYPIEAGEILLQDEHIEHLPDYERAKYFSRVFQDPMLGTAAGMELEENLALALRRGQKRGLKKRITNEEREEYKEKLAKLDLGLENRMQTKMGLFSGGQRQAVTLLMASLVRPKLLLLDEHTAALDPKTAKKVLDLTDELVSEQNLTTLMVTHNMQDALEHGNRLIMLVEGKIVLDVEGAEKQKLSTNDLLAKFEEEGQAVIL